VEISCTCQRLYCNSSCGISFGINPNASAHLLAYRTKKTGVPAGFLSLFVELEGIEPSSKQAAKMLSTCLSFSCGFGFEPGKGDPILYLHPLDFGPCTRVLHGLSWLLTMLPWGRSQA